MTSQPLRSRSQFLALLALVLFTLRAAAIDITKSADDFFHSGAMHYLSNNIPAALGVVTNALEQYPDDEKLKKLEALLKQQQQQQNQNQNQDQKQDQQKSEQQKKQDQKKNQAEQEKQDQLQADQKKDQQKPEQQNQQPKPGDKKEPDKQQQASGNPERQEQMTPEQAMRVLDTVKGDEKVLPLQPVEAKPNSRPLKDW